MVHIIEVHNNVVGLFLYKLFTITNELNDFS